MTKEAGCTIVVISYEARQGMGKKRTVLRGDLAGGMAPHSGFDLKYTEGSSMATKQDQFNDIQKKNLEAAMRLAQMSIENSQRLMELQVATAKSLFEEGVNNAKALTAAKDPKTAMELRTQFAQASTEKMLSCAREIAEMTSRTQAEVGKLVSEQLSSGGQDVFEAMQKMFQGMPITDQNAMTAIQTAMDTTRSAFEQMTKASTDAFQMFNQMAAGATKGRK